MIPYIKTVIARMQHEEDYQVRDDFRRFFGEKVSILKSSTRDTQFGRGVMDNYVLESNELGITVHSKPEDLEVSVSLDTEEAVTDVDSFLTKMLPVITKVKFTDKR